jgi:hypothetical protein
LGIDTKERGIDTKALSSKIYRFPDFPKWRGSQPKPKIEVLINNYS